MASNEVVVGRILGPHGVKGWLKVRSFTDPPANILTYQPWIVSASGGVIQARLLGGRSQGSVAIVHLDGLEDRNAAQALAGADVRVLRKVLGDVGSGEYLWSDLIGLEVNNLQGLCLGHVDYLMDTGANDVLVLRGARRRLIPFVMGRVVHGVALAEGTILVDWDVNF